MTTPKTIPVRQGDKVMQGQVFTSEDGAKTVIVTDPDNPKQGWAFRLPGDEREGEAK